jgi:hypothetical protein
MSPTRLGRVAMGTAEDMLREVERVINRSTRFYIRLRPAATKGEINALVLLCVRKLTTWGYLENADS